MPTPDHTDLRILAVLQGEGRSRHSERLEP